MFNKSEIEFKLRQLPLKSWPCLTLWFCYRNRTNNSEGWLKHQHHLAPGLSSQGRLQIRGWYQVKRVKYKLQLHLRIEFRPDLIVLLPNPVEQEYLQG